MSGGGGKKRTSRAQGWEEAGAEFYQESFPTNEADFEALQRDPSHIATLLPSKQSRAATNKRVRTTDTKSLRRRTSTRARRESSCRRQSTTHDVQVAMLPDLSENLSNEQTTWEEIMQIKAMPVSMAQKKEMKAKLQNATHLRLQGFEQFHWQQRKFWQQFRIRLSEAYAKLELWKHSLKKIEGNFGTGVVAYFLFIKWLMFLNVIIFSLVFLFVVLPIVLLEPSAVAECPDDEGNSTKCCADSYMNRTTEESEYLLDLVQGTGRMERTLLFYGKYPHGMLQDKAGTLQYNLPLAYVCIAIAYFTVSLVAIVKSAAHGFKERLVEGEGQFYHYCNLVFGGWDFCIHNEKSAHIKHKALYNEIKACLEAERLEEERKNRTRDEKTKLIVVRATINLVVVVILLLSMSLIYFVFDLSVERLKQMEAEAAADGSQQSIGYEYLVLLLQFLPSICIVALNLLVPFLFRYLVAFENYKPVFVVRLTLLRTVFLRLSSLAVLVYKLYLMVSCVPSPGVSCYTAGCVCWETYVGQQVYKLLITDFATHVIVTFLVNFPRSLIARHVDNRFAKFIGEQQFDLPKHVLDVVYSQTLCWLGAFYAPLLPSIAAVLCFLMFYVKKFACLVNSTPSSTVYRASRSNSMFMMVVLVAHCLAVVPVAYSVAEIPPSRWCGPFRGRETVWTALTATFLQFPDWLRAMVFWVGTAWFSIPTFIVLVLLLYYYSAIGQANKHMVSVLKNQLVLEGHDKQFLLNRLSEFIKRQQEYQKRIRNAEMMREHDRLNQHASN